MRPGLLLMAGIALPFLQATALPEEPLTVIVNARQSMSRSGGDDVAKLKKLASGVGWEFAPNRETTRALKAIGVRFIRCINVDPLPGAFDRDGRFILTEKPRRLDAHLKTCREVGAKPHIIFGMSVPDALRVPAEEVQKRLGALGQQPGPYVYWNGDWAKFKAHCKAYFDYVLVRNRFPGARFEVGNEPDIDGPFPRLPGPKTEMGSEALYRSYFEVYRHAAEAADEFEKETGVKVSLGGPALAWAFSFKFGDFNWIERFLSDCAAHRLRLDFIGIHFYGNLASLDGGYPSAYPSYTVMLTATRAARDAYRPKTPILMTEWGPSYVTDNSESAAVNASHIGAAWAAAFLNTMLENGIEDALYLVTTDLSQPASHKEANIWGWPALFVNPGPYGKAYPKPIFHVFDMISRLTGRRAACDASREVGAFCAVDQRRRRAQCLLWNFDARIPEQSPAEERSRTKRVTLHIREAAFLPPTVRVERRLVSETQGNAYYLFKRTGRPDESCRTTRVDTARLTAPRGELRYEFDLPPSSVTLVEFSP